jgi:hypothetical protein
MENYRNNRLWGSIVAITMVFAGAAGFIFSIVAAMLVANKD